MHQAILPSAHTPLTEVSTSHLYCGTSAVLPWLFPFSLLRGLLPLLVSSGNLLMFGSCDLRSFSPLQ